MIAPLLRMLRKSARFALYALPCAWFLFTCAHQITPGGGPEDKTGPSVLATEPAYGKVRVGKRDRVVITFSEWISRNAVAKTVSILPPAPGGVRVRVDGRKLEITPAISFAESTTYHIVVTSGLQDLRGNALASPVTVVFSTGDVLDSGRVSGCVVDGGKKPAGAIVALFKNVDSALFEMPDYLTQTDSAAFFSFENVRTGTFRLVAFIDQNNNRRLDPGREVAFAPRNETIAVTGRPDTVVLYPVESDTAGPRIAAAAPLSATALLAALTKPADSASGFAGIEWRIERSDGKGQAPAIRSSAWVGRGRRQCVLNLADSFALAPYRLQVNYRRRSADGSALVRDTMRFNGARPLDTVAPALQSVLPVAAVMPGQEFRLLFTEPVAVTAPLVLVDSLRDTVALSIDSGYADTVVLSPSRRLRPGGSYRMVLLSSIGRDLAGNMLKPRDTTDTVLVPAFKVIEADSLAVSLGGCVTCLPVDPERVWQFVPFTGGTVSNSGDSGGCFSFDSLPAGKGFLGCFSDPNRNKRPDIGALLPWRAPEPYHLFADTVEARARWEIEDVTVESACQGCRKHVPVAPDSTLLPRNTGTMP